MSRSKLLLILGVVGLFSLLIPLVALAQGGGGMVVIRDSDDTNYSDKLSDMSTIMLTGVPALSGEAYEGWLVSDDGSRKESTGILTRDALGNINQTFMLTGDDRGENLFGEFDKFVVTIEPIPDADPGPSEDVAFFHQIPKGGILHIRPLVFSLGGHPVYTTGFYAGQNLPKGVAVGLREQTNTAWVHAGLSARSATLPGIYQHAEHVVNIIEGTGGPNFGDLDGDGSTQNPGDGFGVLGYARDTALHSQLSANSAEGDEVIERHSKEVVASATQAGDWATVARDLALLALQAPNRDVALLFVTSAQSTLGWALNGRDSDGDGTIGRTTGEGGAKQAYWAAQDMGTYTLAPPGAGVPPTPSGPGVGDPNVPNIGLMVLIVGASLLLVGTLVLGGAFAFRLRGRRA